MKKLFVSVLLSMIISCQPALGRVESTAVPNRFPTNGSSTTFNFDFRLTDQTEMQVILRADSTGIDTDLTLNVDYTLAATNNDFSSGGTLTTIATHASGNTLILHREALRTQTVNLIQGQAMPAESTETTFDKQTMAIQDIDKDLTFYISVPKGDPTTALSLELPSSVDRASRTFTFDANGGATATDSATGVTVTAFAETYLDDTTAAATRTTLGLAIGTDVQAWDAQLDDIAALAVTNSNFIVGDGANWVAESGATARTSLGLTIGTDVHAFTTNGNTILTDAGVLSIAGLSTVADKMIYTTASDTYTTTDLTAYSRTLFDDVDAAAWRVTLGVVTAADAIKKDGSVVYTGTGDGFKDEDDMTSDSAVATASQQSIKARIEDRITTGDLIVKAWGLITHPTTVTIGENISGVTNPSTGVYVVSWTVAFSTANYAVIVTPFDASARVGRITAKAAGSVTVSFTNVTPTQTDVTSFDISAIGAQ